jgi:hypothetical protein
MHRNDNRADFTAVEGESSTPRHDPAETLPSEVAWNTAAASAFSVAAGSEEPVEQPRRSDAAAGGLAARAQDAQVMAETLYEIHTMRERQCMDRVPGFLGASGDPSPSIP